MLVHAISWVLSGLALCGAGYALLSARLVLRFDDDDRAPARYAAATLLKPLHFDEPGLRENLESFLAQDYPAPIQFVFGVQDENDTAIALVEQLKREHADADISLIVDPRPSSGNRKVANLVNMEPSIKHDVVVLSDSDICVGPHWLKDIVRRLERPGVGAVSCLYSGAPRGNFWSTLAAMGASYEFLPNVVAALSWQLAEPCLGSTIALKRATLAAIGGFRAFSGYLADDYEMGRAVRGLGLTVSFPPFAVAHTSAEARWSSYFRQERRWKQTTRIIDWKGHAGSVITYAVPLALLGVIFSGFAIPADAVLAVAIVSRLLVKWCIDRKFATYAGPALALPVRDMISFGVFLASFFGGEVHWRGRELQVSPRGFLSGHEVS